MDVPRGDRSAKSVAASLYGACRVLAEQAEKAWEQGHPRGKHRPAAAAIGVPVLAVAAATAFMDEVGAGLLGGMGAEKRAVYAKLVRQPVQTIYARAPGAWWGRSIDPAVVENLELLNAVRNEIVHPDRVPHERTIQGLKRRDLVLANVASEFPSGLLWSQFAIWCYDVAADAARSLLIASGWADEAEEVAWFLSSVVMPYGSTVVPGRRVMSPVAATGLRRETPEVFPGSGDKSEVH